MKKYAFATLFLLLSLSVNSGIVNHDFSKRFGKIIIEETTLTPERKKEEIWKQLCKLYKLSLDAEKKAEELMKINKKIPSCFNIKERNKVTWLAKELNLLEENLYLIFNQECGFNHQAVNKNSLATGIIQFTPETALRLGMISIEGIKFEGKTKREIRKNRDIYISEQIKKMNKLEQLDYVYLYLKPICEKHKVKTYQDLYLSVFFPKALGKNSNFIIGKEKSNTVLWNSNFDLNKDGVITLNEFNQKI